MGMTSIILSDEVQKNIKSRGLSYRYLINYALNRIDGQFKENDLVMELRQENMELRRKLEKLSQLYAELPKA